MDVALPALGSRTHLGVRVGPEHKPRIYVSTANGVVHAGAGGDGCASVELGGARVDGLSRPPSIPNLEIGLLGGSFFNNFVYGVDAAAGVITLSPNHSMVAGLDEKEWRARFRTVRDPLERLESYLAGREVSRPGRRAELEQRREELRAELAALEREATRLGVPKQWHH